MTMHHEADQLFDVSNTTGFSGVFEEDLNDAFGIADYGVIVFMLTISTCVGVFFFFKNLFKTSESGDDFLLGGSNMGTFPMSVSLSSSFITAIEMLGNCAMMYLYGSQYSAICIAFFIAAPISNTIFLPVFFKLKQTSCFEYLQLRFNVVVRTLASLLYIFQMLFYSAVAVYAPAVALSNVTKINKEYIILAVYVVCVIYAAMGGMEAVIITDAFQAMIMIGSTLFVLIYGLKVAGDPGPILSHAYQTDRLEFFNISVDPTKTHTLWSDVIGGAFYWIFMFGVNQASVQKCMSVASLEQAKKGLWTSAVFLTVVYTMNFLTGAVILYYFKDCDPLKSGTLTSDELLPKYVTTVMGSVTGIKGFFLTGILAASLGTVAATLTSISAASSQDILKNLFDINSTSKVARLVTVCAGLISYGLVQVVAKLGSVLQIAITFNGLVSGVILGIFTLGMLFPRANTKGAIIGSTIAMCFVAVIGVGSQVYSYQGMIKEETKQTSVANCTNIINIDSDFNKFANLKEEESVNVLFRISYLWYTAMGTTITIAVGVLTSLLFEKKLISKDLISPMIADLLEKRFKYEFKIDTKNNGIEIRPRRHEIYTIPENSI